MKVYAASDDLPQVKLPEPRAIAEASATDFVRSLLAAKRAITVEYLEDAWLIPQPYALDALLQLHREGKCYIYNTENEDDMLKLKDLMYNYKDLFGFVSSNPMSHIVKTYPEDFLEK